MTGQIWLTASEESNRKKLEIHESIQEMKLQKNNLAKDINKELKELYKLLATGEVGLITELQPLYELMEEKFGSASDSWFDKR